MLCLGCGAPVDFFEVSTGERVFDKGSATCPAEPQPAGP